MCLIIFFNSYWKQKIQFYSPYCFSVIIKFSIGQSSNEFRRDPKPSRKFQILCLLVGWKSNFPHDSTDLSLSELQKFLPEKMTLGVKEHHSQQGCSEGVQKFMLHTYLNFLRSSVYHLFLK